ncbi:MAG: molybdate ABC transporter permease subunit [Gammaproteobacteria bacterium]|nr:MAG: molybdate ABC transporter permease subunit [Gammaproteobacteria bacterium]
MIASWYSPAVLTALWLSLKLAMVTVIALLTIAIPLSWWLAHTRWRLRPVLEALIAMPLILPPTVLGFYLLLFLGPAGWGGQLMVAMGEQPLAFSFTGLVIGSMIYSLPFAVQPLQATFQSIGKNSLEVAATLRASPLDRFVSIVLPLSRRGLLTAGVLTFAHTLGEFGVLLMIGGNIPGRTQVASIAIYSHVEAMDYAAAHTLSLTMLGLSFTLLLVVFLFNRQVRFVSPVP